MITLHETLINPQGFLNTRYRFMDWGEVMTDPDEREKHFKIGRPHAVTIKSDEDGNEIEKPLMHHNGTKIDDHFNEDLAKENTKQAKWTEKQKRGKNPLYFSKKGD